MSDLAIFMFEERTAVRLLNRDGEAWFVLKDICRALGLTNPRRAAQRLDDDEKGVTISDPLGGRQPVGAVNDAIAPLALGDLASLTQLIPIAFNQAKGSP